jgi:predicted amidohydrolase YtcJ
MQHTTKTNDGKRLPRGEMNLIDNLKPDLILFNGNVFTVDDRFSIAHAVAIKGDRIVAVGSSADLKKLKGTRTEMVDLKGKTVIPGFNEGHLHMMSTGQGLMKVNLQDRRIRTISDLIHAVADRVKITPKGEWVEGWGWDQSKLQENRFPTRWDLDRVSPEHPVYLTRTCFHIAVANSKALELAGITKQIPQPEGGEIVKDEKGAPTGALLERPAFSFVEKLIPKPDLRQKKEAIKAACKAFNAAGITSVNDGGLDIGDFQAYQEVMNEGNLTVRVYGMVRLELREISDDEAIAYLRHIGPRNGFGTDYLKMGAIKITMDGGVGGRTALMRTPYITGKANNFGIQSVAQDRLRKIITLANQMGWQMAIHAAGGKAMDNVLAVFREADEETPIRGRRWYLVHAYDPSPENFEDLKRMGVGVATNPGFIHFVGDSFVFNMGREWASHASPLKDYLRHGIPISGGSDAAVTPYPPLYGIYAAVTRKTQLSGEVLGPDQCISVAEALRVFTMGGTWMTFEENIKGSIEPGKLADLVVLGEDILSVHPDRIPDVPVLATYVGGKKVYGDL